MAAGQWPLANACPLAPGPETPDIGARGFSAMGPELANYPLRARVTRGGSYCLRHAFYVGRFTAQDIFSPARLYAYEKSHMGVFLYLFM